MRKLWYCGLEPYKARYTLQLQDWNERVFKRRGIDYEVVYGETLTTDQKIVTGQVLDAHGRTYYSMTQMAALVKLMKEGKITNEDVIYFEDLFTPGMESLPYIINQIDEPMRPRIFVRCLAQTIDPDDFVHTWGMSKWMGNFEKMVNCFVDGILATNEEMVAHMKIAGWEAPIFNISGLAFGKEEVRSRVPNIRPFNDRARRVVFSSRWDPEKNPDFYMDIIEHWHRTYPSSKLEFSICSGADVLRQNMSYTARTKELVEKGWLNIYENLEKNDYYHILNNSRVVLNTASQDWVSNTVSEADALGCNVLFPAYRSFPETFANDPERLYIPWSVEDACNKLLPLIGEPHRNMGKISDYTDGTIDRICDILEEKNPQRSKYCRTNTYYRRNIIKAKY